MPRLALPPSLAWIALLAAAFALPGLGHDPWKPLDAIGISIVSAMAAGGDGIVPRVAGVPWLYDPPLYHWVAAVFARVFSIVMEPLAATRLASAAFVLAALWLARAAARDWTAGEERAGAAAAAPLILLGSVGLVVRAHEAVPELAALAALAGALAALPHAAARPTASGAAFGAGLGLAFLSAAWIAPAALGVAVLAAHLACAEWRSRSALPFLSAASVVCAAVAASWPLALAWRSPEQLAAWWSLASQPQGALGANLRYYAVTGSWFAWPGWPLALWSAWALRTRLAEPRLFVPAAATLLMFAGTAFWGPPQDVNLIAALAPLALLAAQGVSRLRRGAAAALDWFGVMTFSFFAFLVWLAYVAMMTGVPPRLANNFARQAPGLVTQFEPLAFALALALTLGWIAMVAFTARGPTRGVLRWAAGVALLWGTFANLWMPWADHQKSYRAVALQLRSKIPVDAPCVAQKGLGVPQSAALDYHAGIRPRAFRVLNPGACPLLIVQGSPRHELDAPGAGWTKLADVGRPGDKLERYRLYRLNR